MLAASLAVSVPPQIVMTRTRGDGEEEKEKEAKERERGRGATERVGACNKEFRQEVKALR